MDKKRGIYIHMPFCVQKCRYCAFLSFDAEGSPRKEYTDALEKEIKLRAALEKQNGTDKPVNTIYIGGGTPSVMDISSMSEMIKTLRRSFDVDPDAEITMEANPAWTMTDCTIWDAYIRQKMLPEIWISSEGKDLKMSISI